MSEEFKESVEKAHVVKGENEFGETEWTPFPRAGTLSLDEIFTMDDRSLAPESRSSIEERFKSYGFGWDEVLSKDYVLPGIFDDVTIKRVALARLEGHRWPFIRAKLVTKLLELTPKQETIEVLMVQRVAKPVRDAIRHANTLGIRATAVLGDPDIRKLVDSIKKRSKLDWWEIFQKLPSYGGESSVATPSVSLRDMLYAYDSALQGLKFPQFKSDLSNQDITPGKISHSFDQYLSSPAKALLPERSSGVKKRNPRK